MLKKLVIFFVLVIFLLLGLIFQNDLFAASRLVTNYSKCNTPKSYKIGVIDSRFGITGEQLQEDLSQSTEIWSNAAGYELFSYNPEAKLTVNLTYDTRQELNTRIDEIDSSLQQRKSELDPRIKEFDRRNRDFTNRISAFNAEVQKWNAQGGATEEVYNRLIREQESLRNEAAELDSIAAKLGQSTDQYNEEVTTLNQTINSFDIQIQGKPEEGLYERNGREESITIFLHNTKQEFIHTLTHEFGHALGLEHVKNADAIMFSKTNNVITPSEDDLTQLNEICRQRFIGEVVVDYYENIFQTVKTRINI